MSTDVKPIDKDEAGADDNALEQAIKVGTIKLPLMQLTAQQVCEVIGKIKEKENEPIYRIIEYWACAIAIEKAYVKARAATLTGSIGDPDSYKSALNTHYKRLGLTSGGWTDKKLFGELDRIAEFLVTNILKKALVQKG